MQSFINSQHTTWRDHLQEVTAEQQINPVVILARRPWLSLATHYTFFNEWQNDPAKWQPPWETIRQQELELESLITEQGWGLIWLEELERRGMSYACARLDIPYTKQTSTREPEPISWLEIPESLNTWADQRMRRLRRYSVSEHRSAVRTSMLQGKP